MLVQKLHHTVIAAIDVDFANPNRAARLDLYLRVGRSDRGPAYPSKTFPHTLKKSGPIIVPLIAIPFADELGHAVPISAIDRLKEMLCMEADLMLWPPKPEQIRPKANSDRRYANQCSAKRNRHTPESIRSFGRSN